MKQRRLKLLLFYGSLAVLAGLCIALPNADSNGNRDVIMASALLVFAIVNWILETAPIAVTAFAVIAMVPFSGLMNIEETIRSSFGNSIFGFFLGVLLLSYAFRTTNLGKLISRGIFTLFGRKPKAILLGVMIAGALLAMWITEVAAAAIIFPIVLSIWDKTAARSDHGTLGKAMMLGVAWGCAFGGVATPIATGANLVALSYLKTYCGITVSFGQWMLVGVPICVSLILVGWIILKRPLKDHDELDANSEPIEFGAHEKRVAVVFAAAVLLWIFGGQIGLSSHHVAILAALSLFLPGVEIVDWKTAIRNIDWDSIFLISAGVLIGDILFTSGVARQLAQVFFIPSMLHGNLFLRGAYIVLSVSVLKIMFSSNTVSGVVLVPIMISLAAATGLSAWVLVAPCIFSSALSLIVISSSPVNVIPYSSGAFSPKDVARNGILMTLCAAVIIGGWLALFNVH